jgi:hypothetical protein
VRGEAINRGPGKTAGGVRKEEDNFRREEDQRGLPQQEGDYQGPHRQEGENLN